MTPRILPAALTIAALLGLGFPADAFAAKTGEGKKGAQKAGTSLAFFDKNHDGTIDSTEADAMRKHYGVLAAIDTDRDGKLADSEIAAAKLGKDKAGKKNAGKKKGGKKGKRAQKKQP